jgi:hypothetical protein
VTNPFENGIFHVLINGCLAASIKFPVLSNIFPVPVKKFPVPLRREFGCK